MAISAPTLELAVSSGSGASASFTPQANSVLVVIAVADRSSNAPGALTLSNTGGLTFTSIVLAQSANNSGVGQKIGAWRADVGPSPSAMTITITSTSASVILKHAISFLQSEVSPASWPSTAGEVTSGGDPVFDLITVGSNSAVVAAVVSNGTGTFTPPTGHTELVDAGSGFCRTTSSYDNTSPAPDGTFVSTNGKSQVIAFEVTPKVVITVALDPTAYNVAATDLVIRRVFTMALGASEHNWSPTDLVARYNRVAAIGPAAYNWVPTDLSLLRNRRLDMATAAYNWVPSDLEILVNRTLALGSADYQWVPTDLVISLVEPGEIVIGLANTGYNWVPTALSAVYNRNLALNPAAYNVTADFNILVNRRMELGSGNYDVDNGDVLITRTRYMQLERGVYQWVPTVLDNSFHLIWLLGSTDYDVSGNDNQNMYVFNRWRDTSIDDPIWRDTGIYG